MIKEELTDALNQWANKHYYPLQRERDRYREQAQKWMFKCKQVEKENIALKVKLESVKKG